MHCNGVKIPPLGPEQTRTLVATSKLIKTAPINAKEQGYRFTKHIIIINSRSRDICLQNTVHHIIIINILALPPRISTPTMVMAISHSWLRGKYHIDMRGMMYDQWSWIYDYDERGMYAYKSMNGDLTLSSTFANDSWRQRQVFISSRSSISFEIKVVVLQR